MLDSIRFMHDRLFITGSWYHKKTTGLITTVAIPTSSGSMITMIIWVMF
ncbi:MAG: hypothetical protein ACLU4N_10060 [Butyricimonas faecihominis]